MWLLVESAALGTLRDGGGPPGPPDGYGMFCEYLCVLLFFRFSKQVSCVDC